MNLAYAEERQRVIDVALELLSRGGLDLAGGAFALRMADGNVLVSPTGVSMTRWKIEPEDIVAMDVAGVPVGANRRRSAAGTPLFLKLFEAFPAANAIIHTHAEWSLLYASQGRSIPAVINGFDTLGEVPCLEIRDREIKTRYHSSPWPVFFPPAMVDRPDVAAVEEDVAERAIAKLGGRADELIQHAIAFTMFRHGVVVLAKDLDLAAYSLATIEMNASLAYRLELLRAVAPEASASAGSS